MAVFDKDVKRVKLFTKDKENKNQPKDKKPVGTTLSLTSALGKDDGNGVSVVSFVPMSFGSLLMFCFFCSQKSLSLSN